MTSPSKEALVDSRPPPEVTRLIAFVPFYIHFIKVFLRLFSTETLSYYSFTSKPMYVLVFTFLAAAIRFTLENAWRYLTICQAVSKVTNLFVLCAGVSFIAPSKVDKTKSLYWDRAPSGHPQWLAQLATENDVIRWNRKLAERKERLEREEKKKASSQRKTRKKNPYVGNSRLDILKTKQQNIPHVKKSSTENLCIWREREQDGNSVCLVHFFALLLASRSVYIKSRICKVFLQQQSRANLDRKAI